jgi:hypothetical protein
LIMRCGGTLRGMILVPWDNWYHCMGNTFGTWLPGSPKGFRTRHHREHVEGDYKHPPPKGMYDERHEHAKDLMKREPVFLESMDQRQRALDELVASLLRRDIFLAVMSVDRVHLHGLAQFPDHNPRRWIGIAKKESSHYCKQTGHAPEGGLWATRIKCEPVKNGGHFERTIGYILDHANRGAVVWQHVPPDPMQDFDPSTLSVG